MQRQQINADAGARTSGCAGAAGAVDAADRRRAVRVPHCVPFHLRPLSQRSEAAALIVVLQDLSVGGMGVIHSEPLPLGDQYQVPLERIAAGATYSPAPTLVCTVVRCERLDDGLFNIGFEFNSSAAAVEAGSRQNTGKPGPRV